MALNRISDIRVLDLIKNEANGSIYAVREVGGDFLFLIDEKGGESKFRFSGQFSHCSEEEKAASAYLVNIAMARRNPRRTKAANRRAGPDTKSIRAQFADYLAVLRSQDAAACDGFQEFWGGLIGCVGDFPGRSWGMRKSPKFGLNPCLYTADKNGKRVVLANLWGAGSPAGGLSVIVAPKYFKNKFRPLFPRRKSYFGAGASADFPYADIAAGKGEEILACFRSLLDLS